MDSLKTINYAQVSSTDSYNNPTEIDATVREYIPGDDVRKIHWKSTAKTGKLLTRKTIGEEKQGIGIVMDSARYYENPEQYLPIENKIMEIVIAFTMYFVKNHIPVRNYSYHENMLTLSVKDIEEFNTFYSHMSDFRFEKENEQEKMFSYLVNDKTFFDNKLVVFVLHEFNESARNLVDTLCENNVSSVIYLVNDEDNDIKPGKINSLSELIMVSSEADIKEEL